MKLNTSTLIWIFIWSLFMGVTAISIGFGALFPDMNRIAKPFVCPNGRMDVVEQTYNPYPGTTITTLTWYCIDSSGNKTELGIFPMSLYAGIIYGLLLFFAIIVGMAVLGYYRRSQPGARVEQVPDQAGQFRRESEQFRQQAEQFRNSTASKLRASGAALAKMKELKEMRDANLISEAEYEQKRAKILEDL